MDSVERRLRRIVELGWNISYPESRMLVRVLSTSDVHAARVLRDQLTQFDIHFLTREGIVVGDIAHREIYEVFQTTLTPTFIVHLIEALVDTGSLTRSEARVIEKHLLATVDRTGHWKAG